MPSHRIVGLSGPSDAYSLAQEHCLKEFHRARGGFGLDGNYYALPTDGGLEGFFGDVGNFFTRVLKPVTQILPPQLRGLQPFKKPLDALKLVTLPVTLTPLYGLEAAKRNPQLAAFGVAIGTTIATGNPAIGAAAGAGVGAALNKKSEPPPPPPPINYPVVDYAIGSPAGPGEIQGPPVAPVGAYAGPSIPGQDAGALIPTTFGGSALPNWGPTPPPVYSVADNAYQSRQLVTPEETVGAMTGRDPRYHGGAKKPRASTRPLLPDWAPLAAGAVALAYLFANRRAR